VLYSLSDISCFRIFSDYNESEAMYHKADVPDTFTGAGGKYLLQVDDGEEFGVIPTYSTYPIEPCPDYPFFGAKILRKELSL